MIKLFTPIILSCLLFFNLDSQGQEQKQAYTQVIKLTKASNWQPIYKTQALTIDYIVNTCENKDLNVNSERVHLRLNNPSNNAVKIEFDYQLYYDEKCYGCDDNTGEFHKTVILPAKKNKEGSCNTTKETDLSFFSKWIGLPSNKEELSHFQISNIKITSISQDLNSSK
jgi:hypothetical protein